MTDDNTISIKEMFHFGFSSLNQKIDKLENLMQDNNNKIAKELKEVNQNVAKELKEINQLLTVQNGSIIKIKTVQDNCPIDEVKGFLIVASILSNKKFWKIIIIILGIVMSLFGIGTIIIR